MGVWCLLCGVSIVVGIGSGLLQSKPTDCLFVCL